MDELPGSLGTSASLALRFGQTIFSTASLLFMCLDVEFYSYTAFCYLVTVMGLVVPWGMTLVIVDAYFVFVRCLPRQPRIIIILIAGDLALSYLSLAAACSTASTTMLLHDADRSYCPAKLCTRYQLYYNGFPFLVSLYGFLSIQSLASSFFIALADESYPANEVCKRL